MAWLLRWKYRVLLGALVATVAVYTPLRTTFDGRIGLDVAVTVLFLAAVPILVADRVLRIPAGILGLPMLVGLWTGYVVEGVPELPLQVAFHGFATAFLGFAVAALLRGLARMPSVSADAVYGGFCGYILIGLAFGHVYCLADLFTPGAFTGNDALNSDTHRHYLLTYFSFTTLTTVGFGDITPANDTTRGLAIAEAIVGQMYIVVLMAELIGKRAGQPAESPQPKSPN